MFVIKKSSNKGFPNTNEMIEIRRMTFSKSESALETLL